VKRAETSQAEAPTPRVDAEQSAAPMSPAVARRNRALIMLGALSTVVVTVPLVALSLLPLLTLMVPAVSVGGAVAWARAASQAERRRSQASIRRPARPAQSHPAQSQPGSHPAAAEPVHAADVEVEADLAASPAKSELFDVQAVSAPAAVPPAAVRVPARPLVDDDDIPLTWDPVPVPRPTYTMKSRVTRPAPTSADLVGDADTEYAAYEDLPERRVAGA
jgi:hypothetical protein